MMFYFRPIYITSLFIVSSVKGQLKGTVVTESAANLFTLFKAADILFQEVQENASVIKSSLEPAGRKQSCSHTCCERIKYFSLVVRPRPKTMWSKMGIYLSVDSS